MSATLPEGVQLVTPGDLGDELASFLRAMRANNVSPNTITAYGGAVRQFGLWLMERGYPTDLDEIERHHVEEWIASILEHRKPATAHTASVGCSGSSTGTRRRTMTSSRRCASSARRGCRSSCRGSYRSTRFVLCSGPAKAAASRTGATRHSSASSSTPVPDAARSARFVTLPPRRRPRHRPAARARACPRQGRQGQLHRARRQTLVAVEDYLRARKRHAHAALPWLWLGKRGRLTDSGIGQAIKDRGTRAGIPDLHPHDFRHAATHHELAGGMNEADVMSKRGWDSPAMLRRYASTTANERAIEASRRLGLGDKL